MNILLCEYEGKVVSSLVGSAIGDTGIYLLGGTRGDGLKTQASYLLQWRMIRWLKEKGCRFYDLGGINPKESPGVFHFKAGLSGKEVYSLRPFEAGENYLSLLLVLCVDVFRLAQRKVKIAFTRSPKNS